MTGFDSHGNFADTNQAKQSKNKFFSGLDRTKAYMRDSLFVKRLRGLNKLDAHPLLADFCGLEYESIEVSKGKSTGTNVGGAPHGHEGGVEARNRHVGSGGVNTSGGREGECGNQKAEEDSSKKGM